MPVSSIRLKLPSMFLGQTTTVKKPQKGIFLMLFSDANYVEDLENVTVATNVIYNSHTLPFLFPSFPCLSKSLRKNFLYKVNLTDFN